MIGPAARLFRLGGDEFVVTLAGQPDDADLERTCRAIEERAAETFELAAGRAMTGVSIGIAFLEAEDGSMPEVMKRADLALYAAKEISGSAHVFYGRALADAVLERMRIEQEIAGGLAREEFFVEYQPVVSARDREVAAFEALVRWRHPSRGILSPENFIPLAERSGHMVALGRFVLGRAIADAGRWPEVIGIAVNVTCDEFRNPGFIDHTSMLLEIHGVAPTRLTIEITEAAFAIDPPATGHNLARLRALGVNVAVDNFGVGFSSISRLQQFRVDKLKVDRSFTRQLLEGGSNAELVDIILRFGKVLGIRTTIEGVENEDQFEAAHALGAAEVQGFYISHPLPVQAASALACGRAALSQDSFRESA